MKLALYSPSFHPRTGGLEHVVMDLALEFSRAGHSVVVITATPYVAAESFPFQILRRAGFWRQAKAMRQADFVLQFNVSLKGLLPWLLANRPLIVSHQTANWPDLRGRLRAWVADHIATLNIGCSQYMSDQFRQAITIPNPYDDTLFRVTIPWEARSRDLIFVGRLVSDKGADRLLQSLAVLRERGLKPGLCLVGAGPEEANLRAQANALGLEEQVAFAGLIKGEALVELINQHRILVVPSLWDEPFGIIALEGLACGCLVIGSQGGGLSEAIGGLGLTYPNRDVLALTDCLEQAVKNADSFLPHPKVLEIHLQRHSRSSVAREYLALLERLHTHRTPQKTAVSDTP